MSKKTFSIVLLATLSIADIVLGLSLPSTLLVYLSGFTGGLAVGIFFFLTEQK